MVVRNCLVPTQLCHQLARPMVERGRGGIILVSSGAALVGARRMAAYGASKAFDLVLGEALWAELHDQGVDVLSLVLGVTDTPGSAGCSQRRAIWPAPMTAPDTGRGHTGRGGRRGLRESRGGSHVVCRRAPAGGLPGVGRHGRNEAAQLMLNAGAGVMDQKLS